MSNQSKDAGQTQACEHGRTKSLCPYHATDTSLGQSQKPDKTNGSAPTADTLQEAYKQGRYDLAEEVRSADFNAYSDKEWHEVVSDNLDPKKWATHGRLPFLGNKELMKWAEGSEHNAPDSEQSVHTASMPKVSNPDELDEILLNEELIGNLEITHGEVIDGDYPKVKAAIEAYTQRVIVEELKDLADHFEPYRQILDSPEAKAVRDYATDRISELQSQAGGSDARS